MIDVSEGFLYYDGVNDVPVRPKTPAALVDAHLNGLRWRVRKCAQAVTDAETRLNGACIAFEAAKVELAAFEAEVAKAERK